MLVLVGATGGATNTGIAIFDFPDEETAHRIVAGDPAGRGATPAGTCVRSTSAR